MGQLLLFDIISQFTSLLFEIIDEGLGAD